jgi:DHA2 family multidrug resistance protein
VQSYLAPLGLDPQSVAAAEQIVGQVMRQASMLAFQDAFWLTGWAAFLMLPVVLILQRPKPGAAAPVAAH